MRQSKNESITFLREAVKKLFFSCPATKRGKGKGLATKKKSEKGRFLV